MQNSTVVSSLVPSRTILLLEQKQLHVWKPFEQLVRRCEPNDPPANYCNFHVTFPKANSSLLQMAGQTPFA